MSSTLVESECTDTLMNFYRFQGVEQSHLNFVDGLPLLQTLGPHRDAPLAVAHTPALLAQALRLEAGERPVVRDGHSLCRHGWWWWWWGGERWRERGVMGGDGEGGGGSQRLLPGPVETR